MKKPYIRGSRFLNHGHERISSRLGNWASSVWLVLGKMLKYAVMHKKTFKVKIDRADVIKNWMTPVQVAQSSTKPVITWLGHATFLIQINGLNILTDPSFFEISLFLPRLTPSPVAPKDLPNIDVILVSHNHPDHLDSKSVRALKKHGHNPVVLMPKGTKRWFSRNKFSEMHEKIWGQEHVLNNVNFTFLPAAHWSGTNLIDTNQALWGSWMIEYNNFKVYFTGDSAYSDHFSEIGQKFGTIDVALMPIAPNTPEHLVIDSHVNTQESVQAFGELRAQNFIPMHWGVFPFEQQPFEQPINLLYAEWDKQQEKLKDKKLHVLKIGQSQLF